VVVVVGGGEDGVQDPTTPATGSVTGNEIADNGVPGGTFTVNDNL
jgi:hypothetical protein